MSTDVADARPAALSIEPDSNSSGSGDGYHVTASALVNTLPVPAVKKMKCNRASRAEPRRQLQDVPLSEGMHSPWKPVDWLL